MSGTLRKCELYEHKDFQQSGEQQRGELWQGKEILHKMGYTIKHLQNN